VTGVCWEFVVVVDDDDDDDGKASSSTKQGIYDHVLQMT
jgi:hypothetical protein